jgi:hypothetical protein
MKKWYTDNIDKIIIVVAVVYLIVLAATMVWVVMQ